MTQEQRKVWDDYMQRISELDWATVALEIGDTSPEAAKALAQRNILVNELTLKLQS